MVASTDTKVSKTVFVTGLLGENPEANTRAVNEAWAERGHSGTISPTLVQKLRYDLGLAGNIRKRARPVNGQAGKRAKKSPGGTNATKPKLVETPLAPRNGAEPKAKAKSEAAPAPIRASAPVRPGDLLDELEKDFDRLIFKLMTAGGLTEAEDALRRVRRQVVRSLDA